MKRWLKHLEVGFEEIILFLIVILNVLDAFEIIGSDLDYIKKIISWAALGYLLYKAKLSKLFVGEENSKIDFALIIGYFLLTIKNLISYAIVEVNETSVFLKDFFVTLVQNAAQIETFGIYVGLAILLVTCIHLSFIQIKKPSVLHVIHAKETKPKNIGEFFLRLVSILGVVFGFFIVFFNLIMEWLAIAIDAPLLMIGLAIYIFFIVRHKDKFSETSFLTRFGDFGSRLYTDVLKHIQYKKTILRTVSAMIVLHVITDTLTFVWPFLFGFGDRLYLGLLSQPHLSIYALLSSQLAHLPSLEAISLIIIYIGNIIALLFFLLFPFYTWFVLYKDKIMHPKKIQLSILVSSLVMFFLSPVFKIEALIGQNLFGVDIIGQASSTHLSFSTVVLIALAVGILIELYSAEISHEKWVVMGLIFLSQGFLFFYMLLYLYSISTFYTATIAALFANSMSILLIFFCIIFAGTILFYLTGIGNFIKNTFKHAMEHISLERKRF